MSKITTTTVPELTEAQKTKLAQVERLRNTVLAGIVQMKLTYVNEDWAEFQGKLCHMTCLTPSNCIHEPPEYLKAYLLLTQGMDEKV